MRRRAYVLDMVVESAIEKNKQKGGHEVALLRSVASTQPTAVPR